MSSADLTLTDPVKDIKRERDMRESEFLEICKKHENEGDFYVSKKLRETKANYQICLGQRSDGKSYDAKKIDALLNFFCYRFHFAYVRIEAQDVKATKAEEWFGDMTNIIDEAASIVYPGFDSYFLVAKSDKYTLIGESYEPFVREKLAVMGYYFALPKATNYKGSSFPNIKNIIFDEILTTKATGQDEFKNFMSIVSTIRRYRTDVTIRMLGNTINRHSEILNAMGVNLNDIRRDEITLYRFIDEQTGGINTVAVEWQRVHDQPAESAAYSAFGRKKELHINTGEWETGEYPIGTADLVRDKLEKNALIIEDDFCRLYCYIVADKGIFITRERIPLRKIIYHTITTGRSDLRRRIFNVETATAKLWSIRLLEVFYSGQMFFDNNLTGDDFEHFINK